MLSKKDIYREKQFDKCLKKYCQICQCLNLMTLDLRPRLFVLEFNQINLHRLIAIDIVCSLIQEIL